MFWFAGLPLCLRTAALHLGYNLHSAVPQHQPDFKPIVLIGNTLHQAVPNICGVAVRKTDWFPKLPPHSGEPVTHLIKKKRDVECTMSRPVRINNSFNIHVQCMSLHLFRLFDRFFIHFPLTAKRYPILWFWSLDDFLIRRILCLSLSGLANTENYMWAIDNILQYKISWCVFRTKNFPSQSHKMFLLEQVGR